MKKMNLNLNINPDGSVNGQAIEESTVSSNKSTLITSSNLNNRAKNALTKAGFKNLEELNDKSISELKSIQGVGQSVIQSLREEGVTLLDEPKRGRGRPSKEVSVSSKNMESHVAVNDVPETSKDKEFKIPSDVLSSRCNNALIKAGIKYASELNNLSEKEILKLRGIGKTVMNELRSIIGKGDLNAEDSLANLDLSPRTFNALRNNDIHTLSELVLHPEVELKKMNGIGSTVLKEIKNVISSNKSKLSAPKDLISKLDISNRTQNALANAGIYTVTSLKETGLDNLKSFDGIGNSVLAEAYSILGMEMPEAPKRGRGRPRKEKVEAKTEEPKRGRGRPRKEKVEAKTEEPKRGRGRPRKEKVEATTTVAKTEAPKRGRGRPKKVLLTSLGDISTRTMNVLEREGIETVAQLMNISNEDLKNKKGVGKAFLEEISAIRDLAANAESSTTTVAKTEEPKRGRGRPRKEKVEATTTVAKTEEPKRGRGRPRKEKVEATTTVSIDTQSDSKTKLEELTLSTRAEKALLSAGIKFVEDLNGINLTELQGVGATIAEETQNRLNAFVKAANTTPEYESKQKHDINSLSLSAGVANKLLGSGIKFAEELNSMSDNELKNIGGIGNKAIEKIRSSLSQLPMIANA